MRVHVDESGREDEPLCRDLHGALGEFEFRIHRIGREDGDDPRALHRDVGHVPGRPRPVDDGGSAVHPHLSGGGLLGTQKHVATAPITRGSAASGSSITATTLHLSKAVHGWESPRRTTSPTATVSSPVRLRNAC